MLEGAPSRVSRRVVLAGGGASLLASLAACADDDDPAVPTETPAPEPTPTQAPISSPVASYLNPERWVGRTLTIASLGGDYQDAQNEAFFAPFAQATGATVQQRGVDDIDDFKAQVDTGPVTWDVVCLVIEDVFPLARAGYLEPIDYNFVDDTTLIQDVVGQFHVGADLFSTVIVYPTSAVQAPSGWTEFWNPAAFPENRSLKKSPIGTLEFALLADGVVMADLYPLDIERAFANLEKIRPHVLHWWEDGKQPVELVANDQVGLAGAWNVRTALPDVRGLVAVQWRGGMLSADAWVVPKGAPNSDVAMDFINYATRAVPMANFARLVPFGPVNPDAFQYLREDRLPYLPSAEPQIHQQFFENWNYWDDNREVLDERFLEWLASEPEPTGTAE
jgi:putative spermidine/putrescine transport system substrate-binding protein